MKSNREDLMTDFVATLVNATKYYGKRKVLDDISVELLPGKILGLIGPSGSGKTTTIKCLMGMETLDEVEAQIIITNITKCKKLSDKCYIVLIIHSIVL